MKKRQLGKKLFPARPDYYWDNGLYVVGHDGVAVLFEAAGLDNFQRCHDRGAEERCAATVVAAGGKMASMANDSQRRRTMACASGR